MIHCRIHIRRKLARLASDVAGHIDFTRVTQVCIYAMSARSKKSGYPYFEFKPNALCEKHIHIVCKMRAYKGAEKNITRQCEHAAHTDAICAYLDAGTLQVNPFAKTRRSLPTAIGWHSNFSHAYTTHIQWSCAKLIDSLTLEVAHWASESHANWK